MDRPEWNKLYEKAKEGDTIVFDSVSRMARNAAEGVQIYFELYEKGIQLIFCDRGIPSSKSNLSAVRSNIKSLESKLEKETDAGKIIQLESDLQTLKEELKDDYSDIYDDDFGSDDRYDRTQ